MVRRASENTEHPDKYFCPAAYLYRHYLELALKGIIQEGAKLTKVSVPRRLLHKHDLQARWNKARTVIFSVWPDGDASQLNTTEAVVLDFHKADNSGQAFRYTVDKKDERHLSDLPRVITLDQLAETMDEVHRILDGCATGIAESLNDLYEASDYYT